MIERGLIDKPLFIPEITTSANPRRRAGALSGCHLDDASHPHTYHQADRVVEAEVKFARFCIIALGLCRAACVPLSRRPRGLMSPLGLEALLMGNFNVL